MSRNDRQFWQSARRNKYTYMQYYNRLTELSVCMFDWKNVPDTIDVRFLELCLFADGMSVFFKDDELGFLALRCAIGGPMNVYRIPVKRRAYANNGYNKDLDEDNSVIIWNNEIHTNAMLDVYNYATPTDEITEERISAMRERASKSDYVKALSSVYAEYEEYTDEVAFFVEQVTGHMIPDFQPALKYGVRVLMDGIDKKLESECLSDKKKANLLAMKKSLECAITLANRYADIAKAQKETASAARKKELELLEATLRKVPEKGAETLYEAMQSYILLWQIMCLEQAPNPFAFSVGNADRIFEPYRAMENLSREESAALFRHFLVFFNVGERSWAISQNILVSGKDAKNADLTNEMTYAILDAYYDMNLPQPILSVKVHKNTPQKLYEELGRFFFTPGVLTPSMFNDDSLFAVLGANGVDMFGRGTADKSFGSPAAANFSAAITANSLALIAFSLSASASASLSDAFSDKISIAFSAYQSSLSRKAI